MSSEFDDLEQLVMADMRQTYTETTIDHAMNPRNVGSMAEADGFGSVTGPCGDTMEIWIKVRNDTVAQATFWTDGCGTSIACGSVVTETVTGRPVVEALKVSQQRILDALGGLPDDSVHCALLAANTMKSAVRDYLSLKSQPWKRDYRLFQNR